MGLLWFGSAGVMGLVGRGVSGVGDGEVSDGGWDRIGRGREKGGLMVRSAGRVRDWRWRIGLLDLLGGFGLMSLRISEVLVGLGIGFRWVLGILGVGLGEFWV